MLSSTEGDSGKEPHTQRCTVKGLVTADKVCSKYRENSGNMGGQTFKKSPEIIYFFDSVTGLVMPFHTHVL